MSQPPPRPKVGFVAIRDDVPERPSRDLTYTCTIGYSAHAQRYRAMLDSYRGEGTSMADALHAIANQLDAAKVHGSEFYDSDHIRGMRLKPCQYCGAPMFFAKTRTGRWMPVEGHSVTASDCPNARRFVIVDIGGEPHVKSLTNPQGEVWIPHPEVCGLSERPKAPALLARWERNRAVVEKRNSAAVADLQKIVDDLS